MSPFSPRTIAAFLLLAGPALLSGCLKARETDRVLYEPQRDQFRLVMILEHIDGGTSDMEYLDAIRQNKDYLIAPCMPGDALGFAPWFLRLSDHMAAKVTFTQPRAGDMQPIVATAALSAIDIAPGTFFVEDNTLCYYHALTVPGKTLDALIEQTRKEQLNPLKKAVQAELERRKKGGRVHTWAELTTQEVDALKNGSADHPLKPFMVLQAASLDKLVQMTGDVKNGIVRQGKDFTITLPLTPLDRQGICDLWTTWVKTSNDTAAQKKDDPLLAMQRLPAQSVTISPVDAGVVLSIDIVKFYNAMAEAFVMFNDSQSPFHAPSQPASEIHYATQHHWPLQENLTAAQILSDFSAGTLKKFPSSNPVKPGSSLKIQPKK